MRAEQRGAVTSLNLLVKLGAMTVINSTDAMYNSSYIYSLN